MKRIASTMVASAIFATISVIPTANPVDAQLQLNGSIAQQPNQELYGLKNGHSDMPIALIRRMSQLRDSKTECNNNASHNSKECNSKEINLYRDYINSTGWGKEIP